MDIAQSSAVEDNGAVSGLGYYIRIYNLLLL